MQKQGSRPQPDKLPRICKTILRLHHQEGNSTAFRIKYATSVSCRTPRISKHYLLLAHKADRGQSETPKNELIFGL